MKLSNQKYPTLFINSFICKKNLEEFTNFDFKCHSLSHCVHKNAGNLHIIFEGSKLMYQKHDTNLIVLAHCVYFGKQWLSKCHTLITSCPLSKLNWQNSSITFHNIKNESPDDLHMCLAKSSRENREEEEE